MTTETVSILRGIPFAILDFRAPEPVLRERIGRRQRWGGDASEANLAVLEHQLVTQEPLTPAEQALAIPVDAEGTPEVDQVLAALRARFS